MAPNTDTMVKQTVQAVFLSAVSNILAQSIQITRSDQHQVFDFRRLQQFVVFAALNTPPNILWQSLLEESFPATTEQPRIRRYQRTSRASDFSELKTPNPSGSEDGENERNIAKQDVREWEDEKKNWTEEVTMEKRLDVKNTAIKFVLDQTLGALVNTIIFVAGMAGLRGEGWDSAVGHVQADTLPLMIAGYKLWPLVSLLSFTVIPVNQRIVFGSLVGVGWGVFLSLFASH